MKSSDRGCIVFVSPGPDIAAPTSGHGARLHHLSKGLADTWTVIALVPEGTTTESIGWIDDVYAFDQWSAPFLTDLNPSFIRALWRAFDDHEIDIVHLSQGVCGARAITTVRRSDARVVYTAQNVEAELAQDFVNPELPAHKRILGPRLIPLIERATVACADLITTVSENDRESFIARYGIDRNRIEAIPTGTQSIDQEELESPRTVRERLGIDPSVPLAVFHGSYAHPPNEEAVRLIAEEITPKLRERGLEIQFLLVGKGIPEVGGENVMVAGFVDDLLSVLNAADFAVVPLRHGGGTKTKMFDYISLGLPVVTTCKGAEGIELVDGDHGIITEDVDEQFLSAVAELAQSETTRQQLGEQMKTLAETLTWSRSVDRLDRFYRENLSSE